MSHRSPHHSAGPPATDEHGFPLELELGPDLDEEEGELQTISNSSSTSGRRIDMTDSQIPGGGVVEVSLAAAPPPPPPPPPVTPDRNWSGGGGSVGRSSSAGSTARTEPLGTPSTLGSRARGHSRSSSRSSSGGFSDGDAVPTSSAAAAAAASPQQQSASASAVTAAAANTSAAAAALSAPPPAPPIGVVSRSGSGVGSTSASASGSGSGSGSGSASSGHSSATSSLIGLVKQQAELVKNLTDANRGASEELRRVQEEKRRMERELAKTKEEIQRKRSDESAQARTVGAVGTAGTAGTGGFGSEREDSYNAAGAIGAGAGVGVVTATVSEWAPFEKEATIAVVPQQAAAQGGQGSPGNQAVVGGGLKQASSPSKSAAVFDEWSTVVYPEADQIMAPVAATTVATVATPVDEYGFAVEDPSAVAAAKGRKKRKKKAVRKSVTVPPKPKTIPLVGTDLAPPLKIPTREPTCSSRFWAAFSRACTCCIPDFLICRRAPRAKQAWREKVAICLVAVSVSAFFVGVFGLVPLLFCTEQEIYTWEDIDARNAGVLSVRKDMWTVIHGRIYDLAEFGPRHPGGAGGVAKWTGRDASRMFPRLPAEQLPSWCLNPRLKPTNLTEYTTAACVDYETDDDLMAIPCHNMSSTLIGPEGIRSYLGGYKKGTLAHSHQDLHANTLGFDWMVVYDKVYNVTAYTRHMRDGDSGRIVADSPNGFLNSRLNKMIVNKVHSDATEVFESMYNDEVRESYLKCLDDMYFAGVVDSRDDPVCDALNIMMYAILVLVLLILVLQFVCSLMYVARGARSLTAEMEKAKVMVMVPCYNEGEKELGKTIKSVVEADYHDDKKVLLVVCDGLITGRGERRSTPETVAEILGYKMDMGRDKAHSYRSIGASTRNKAFVYHGTYKRDNRELKYIVVVKCGTSKERPSPRAGNRGKRDSQLLLLGAFNRIHYGRELCDLDVAVCRALNNLDLGVEDLRYLMTIDADTRVHRDAVSRMVYSMEREDGQLACSGETRVDNKANSLVSMIQVYEYFASHHMKKAFESVFGCVTCLPGCFTMYRIRSIDDRPLLACDNVFGEYSRNDIESLHEKNLYHLGEDRMLTTLLLKYFPDMKLSFVPEALCWTIVPHTFRVLLSQRRRWINSTFHNMWELLKIEGLCGVCIFSMKTVVVADMIATMILPASFLYAAYFVYTVFAQGTAMSETLLIIYGVIIGCQMLVFIIRSRWDYFLWFFAYLLLGIPIFFFLLPIYSFWNMDDLSWGQTRQVAAEKERAKGQQDEEEDGFDDEDGVGADVETGRAGRAAPAPPLPPRSAGAPAKAAATSGSRRDLPEPSPSPRPSPSSAGQKGERRHRSDAAAGTGGGGNSPRAGVSWKDSSRRHSSAPAETMLAVV